MQICSTCVQVVQVLQHLARRVTLIRVLRILQVVRGAQTLKVNLSGGRATGVTFVTKGPDGRRHTGAPLARISSRVLCRHQAVHL